MINTTYYKDWSNAGYELEALGRRLDAVRDVIASLTQRGVEGWALQHWKNAEAVLVRKWKHTVRLKETGLRQVGRVPDQPTISYDWWEQAEEVGGLFTMFWANLAEKLSGGPNLERAWAMAQEEKVQKARLGQA